MTAAPEGAAVSLYSETNQGASGRPNFVGQTAARLGLSLRKLTQRLFWGLYT